MDRAIYSTVNRATREVSTPNQTLIGIEWNAGTVSRIVTTADVTIKAVENTCIRNAAGEEAGFSRTACKVRFHSGPAIVKSRELPFVGNISPISSVSGPYIVLDLRRRGMEVVIYVAGDQGICHQNTPKTILQPQFHVLRFSHLRSVLSRVDLPDTTN